MRLLLDTCTFLWLIAEPEKLSGPARVALGNPESDAFLSAASVWECALKHRSGKLPLPGDPARFLPEQRLAHGIAPLPIDEAALAQIGKLPDHHRDPFDRILVCQAIVGGMTLVTPDPWLARYPVPILW
jgi:PIN domain nuclease of toxin-antitoxin system